MEGLGQYLRRRDWLILNNKFAIYLDMKRALLGQSILVFSGFFLIALGYVIKSSGASLVGICIFLGLLIKGTDGLIDDARLKKFRFLIFPFAIAVPLIIGYLAYTYDPVFGMVIGTAVGLLLSGKIDHPGFVVSFVAFIVIMILLVIFGNLQIATTSIYIIPFAFAGSFLDELSHERTAEGEHGALHQFFEHRPLLKIAAVICTLLGFAQIIHLVAFFCFDIAYDVTAFSLKEDRSKRDSIKSEKDDGPEDKEE